MKKYIIFILISLSSLISCSVTQYMFTPTWGPGDLYHIHGTFNHLPIVLQDSTGLYWTLYTSNTFGYWEFWAAYSKTRGNWSKPLYTAIPANPNYSYRWAINDKQQFDIKRSWRGSRENYFPRQMYDEKQSTYTLNKNDIFSDTDADGFTDYAEYVSFTDPYNNDTDGDGKADGFDQNPLAGHPDSLDEYLDLHKFIIERQLDLFASKRMVIVEQFNNTPLEYKRDNGIVLSLTPEECDDFLDTFGYGVPILTASIKDTTNNNYLVNYQMFIDPNTAFGFDAVYGWHTRYKQWVRKKMIYNWEAAGTRRY